MSYELIYTRNARNDVKKLDIVVKKRLKKKFEIFQKDPFFYAERLSNYRLGSFRWRIGTYRVIFDVDDSTIVILRIRHRRDVYKN
jgi:mRNA interferase RelE/StbE